MDSLHLSAPARNAQAIKTIDKKPATPIARARLIELVWRRLDDRFISEMDERQQNRLALEYGLRALASRQPTEIRDMVSHFGKRELEKRAFDIGSEVMRRKLAERPLARSVGA